LKRDFGIPVRIGRSSQWWRAAGGLEFRKPIHEGCARLGNLAATRLEKATDSVFPVAVLASPLCQDEGLGPDLFSSRVSSPSSQTLNQDSSFCKDARHDSPAATAGFHETSHQNQITRANHLAIAKQEPSTSRALFGAMHTKERQPLQARPATSCYCQRSCAWPRPQAARSTGDPVDVSLVLVVRPAPPSVLQGALPFSRCFSLILRDPFSIFAITDSRQSSFIRMQRASDTMEARE
jgi:hypothetical protein